MHAASAWCGSRPIGSDTMQSSGLESMWRGRGWRLLPLQRWTTCLYGYRAQTVASTTGIRRGVLPANCYRIALRFAILLCIVVIAGCGTGASNRDSVAALDAKPQFFRANDVVVHALSLIGTPYRYGGNTPESGFDCSGLIQHVFRNSAGLLPPRTVADLQLWGRPISAHERRSGDVVLFGRGRRATHAGIYVGNGRFVHAPSSGGTVRLDYLSSHYWSRQTVSFRRPGS